ncbi:hypothetical protein AADZ90_006865 [Aestuariibius sp. 2305UL40-4]|uniref:hypothetical protein n=1 Tax=Aestuariibius violaceus TaxID=3234132 RepID=UPI00345EEBF8
MIPPLGLRPLPRQLDGSAVLTSSWAGGRPSLGGARIDPDLAFIAQIDLADVARFRPGNGLPDHGHLAIFLDRDRDGGAIIHVVAPSDADNAAQEEDLRQGRRCALIIGELEDQAVGAPRTGEDLVNLLPYGDRPWLWSTVFDVVTLIEGLCGNERNRVQALRGSALSSAMWRRHELEFSPRALFRRWFIGRTEREDWVIRRTLEEEAETHAKIRAIRAGSADAAALAGRLRAWAEGQRSDALSPSDAAAFEELTAPLRAGGALSDYAKAHHLNLAIPVMAQLHSMLRADAETYASLPLAVREGMVAKGSDPGPVHRLFGAFPDELKAWGREDDVLPIFCFWPDLLTGLNWGYGYCCVVTLDQDDFPPSDLSKADVVGVTDPNML